MVSVQLRKISKYTARGISPRYVKFDGLMVLNQKCIRNQKIDIQLARLTDKNKKFGLEKKLCKFDILINSTGIGTLGRIAQLKDELEATVDSHVTIFRPAEFLEGHDIKIDPLYIGYCIRNQEKFIESMGAGATGQTELSKNSILDQVYVNLTDYSIQTNISSILSKYDDLIENNEKRIIVLEEMAQLLYAEWFIKFKFPGHEKVKMIDSKSVYGMIPEGWEIKKLGDIIQIKKGKNITKDTVINGDVAVVAGGIEPAYFHNISNTVAPVITISASGAGAGFVKLYYQDIWASDCSYIDKNTSEYVYFFYLFLKNKQKEISNLQRGSAQPHVYPKDLMGLKIIHSQEFIIRFNNLVTPLFELVDKLKEENIKLNDTRDLLIPQLVTGKTELKN